MASTQEGKNTITCSSSNPPPPLCKHWARSKSCLYHNNGGKCKFHHPKDYQIPLSSVQTAAGNNGKNRHRSAGGRLQTRNDTRVAKFRAFVATKLIPTNINLSECRILDVAGGKGEMAFQLLNLSNAATCHVIDPRPLSLGRFQKRLQRGFYHRSASVLHKRDVVTRLGDAERKVGHLRCFFSHELWDSNNGDMTTTATTRTDNGNLHSNNVDLFESNCKNAQAWSWPPKGGNHEHAAHNNKNDHDDNDNSCDDTEAAQQQPTMTEILPTFEHASAIVKRANLIVAMHPDQAVDAIVDAALALDISFFVVPCCTYSQEFRHRRLANGKHVTTYEELLEYLQNKSPDIQRQVLPFEGKNVCLYRIVK